MLRVDREHQPVEEAAALGRRAVEQRVHRRREPDHAQVVRKGSRRGDASRSMRHLRVRGTIHRLPADRCRCRALRDRACLRFRLKPPRRRRLPKRRALPGRAPQSAAGRKQRNRFDQVGLAGAVGAGEHHRPGTLEKNLRGVIAAEIGERQSSDEGGGHWLCFRACAATVSSLTRPPLLEERSKSASRRMKDWPYHSRRVAARRSSG